MRSVLALCLTLVCFVDKSYGTFAEFFSNLPSEVANAFGSAWGSITDAIKKPVRIKRPGRGGKLKSTTTESITSTEFSFKDKTNTPVYTGIEDSITTIANIGNKLTLPLLPSPKFKSIADWRNMQKALYAERQKLANPAPILIFEDASIIKPRSRHHYDDDSFATLMNL